jgi:membrane-associated phospholipid phosphatase
LAGREPIETRPPPGGRLALRLGLGALLLVVAAWIFGAIAEDVVTSDRLTLLDVQVAQWLHRHGSAPLTTAMLVVSDLHSTVAVSCYSALVAVALALRRRWRRLTLVIVAIGGGLALNVLMKLAFHRARPVFDDPLLTLSSYSFPSGHVAGSTILYGLAVLWLFERTRRRSARAFAVIGAALMIALVAFSRMYLGVHYLSDVGAAFAEGVAWLSICAGALAAFWRETRGRP